MNTVPDYLVSTKATSNKILAGAEGYQPLLAAWALKLVLSQGWYKHRNGRRCSLIEEDEFANLIGLEIKRVFDNESNKIVLIINEKTVKNSDSVVGSALKKRLAYFSKQPVLDNNHLFENIGLLGDVIGLTSAERAIFAFVALMQLFSEFRGILSNSKLGVSMQEIAELIALLTGQSQTNLLNGLQTDSALVASGIIHIRTHARDIDDKFSLLDGLGNLLTQKYQDADTLIARFLKSASPAKLQLPNFPHLTKDAKTLAHYLNQTLAAKEQGTNILFYGVPGTGKTEFVKALSNQLGADLYEISFADDEGDPITGHERLRAYNLCQRVLAGRRNALLMFDEIEDVFPSQGGLLALLGLEDGGSNKSNKAWINRTLERNATPAIWVTNDANIDPAYLRRFDYSIRFPVPPQAVRMEIARHHLGQFNPTDCWLQQIAANEQMTPAQYERAAKLARISSQGDEQQARELVEQTLDRSATLLGQKRKPSRNTLHTGYDLRFANTSMAMTDIISGLKKKQRGTFCFFGPAGTGKSELARYIADQIGMPCLVKRASDILSKWVGEAEQNIAAMFAEACQQEAVLVLDEADSFLADRRDARQSWEVTQVNELLTQIEAFNGIFICTTNLMEKLDQASLRRFDFKVKFDFLNPDQCWEMFTQELIRLGGEITTAAEWEKPVRDLSKLTPGDFAVAARQLSILDMPATAAELHRQLLEECKVKGGATGKIGFVN